MGTLCASSCYSVLAFRTRSTWENGTDAEDVIKNAFKCFDPENKETINEDYMRELLMSMGERFTEEECDDMFNEAKVDKKGNFNYIEFVRLIKHGPKDE